MSNTEFKSNSDVKGQEKFVKWFGRTKTILKVRRQKFAKRKSTHTFRNKTTFLLLTCLLKTELVENQLWIWSNLQNVKM